MSKGKRGASVSPSLCRPKDLGGNGEENEEEGKEEEKEKKKKIPGSKRKGKDKKRDGRGKRRRHTTSIRVRARERRHVGQRVRRHRHGVWTSSFFKQADDRRFRVYGCNCSSSRDRRPVLPANSTLNQRVRDLSGDAEDAGNRP